MPWYTPLSWTSRDGEICRTAAEAQFVIAADSKRHQRTCAEGGCGEGITAASPEMTVYTSPTTDSDGVLLDFSNVTPKIGSYVKATLRYFVKKAAGGDPASRPLSLVIANGDFSKPACSTMINWNSYDTVECDVSQVVERWLNSGAETTRTLELGVQYMTGGLTYQSTLATDSDKRPVIAITYVKVCQDGACPGW
jgi:hypothetical protein